MASFEISDSALALIAVEATRRGFPDATALIDAHMASLVTECRAAAIKSLAAETDDTKIAEIAAAFEAAKVVVPAEPIVPE